MPSGSDVLGKGAPTRRESAGHDPLMSTPAYAARADAPPTPVAKNAQAFYQWALDNNYPPIGFYSAYPGLSVLDIRALLADYRK